MSRKSYFSPRQTSFRILTTNTSFFSTKLRLRWTNWNENEEWMKMQKEFVVRKKNTKSSIEIPKNEKRRKVKMLALNNKTSKLFSLFISCEARKKSGGGIETLYQNDKWKNPSEMIWLSMAWYVVIRRSKYPVFRSRPDSCVCVCVCVYLPAIKLTFGYQSWSNQK